MREYRLKTHMGRAPIQPAPAPDSRPKRWWVMTGSGPAIGLSKTPITGNDPRVLQTIATQAQGIGGEPHWVEDLDGNQFGQQTLL